MAKSIKEVNIEEEIKKNSEIKKEDDKDIEQISLSQSLHSQDNGKTFKDIISFNQNKNKDNNEIDLTKILFYPPKEEGDIIFYANEQCFIFLRYIFCIYERLNKLNEYSFKNAENLLNINSKDGKSGEEKAMIIEKINSKDGDSVESLIFKNFIIIFVFMLVKTYYIFKSFSVILTM